MSTPAAPHPSPEAPISSQPTPSIFPEAPPLKVNKWSQGLCGCLGDFGLSISALCVPCVIFGRNAEALNKDCFLWGFLSTLPCVFGTLQRGEIRERKGIEGTRCNDFLTWTFCPYCALVQEANEMQRYDIYSSGEIMNRT